jgi:hypothetical protein
VRIRWPRLGTQARVQSTERERDEYQKVGTVHNRGDTGINRELLLAVPYSKYLTNA